MDPHSSWSCCFKRRKPFDVDFKRAQELIDEKAIADDYFYKGEGVQKGTAVLVFHQMDGLFINVNKKYDFDNLSQADIETLIEDKLQKTLIKFCTTGKRKDFG
jgi:DNA topoisomerase-1